jgi:hypothetical protein
LIFRSVTPHHSVTDVLGQCGGPSFKGQDIQEEFMTLEDSPDVNFITYDSHMLAGLL